MSWDGTKIIMGTIHRNYVFLRCPGQTVEEAIVGRDACMIWENTPDAADNRKQFEAVAWYPDGNTVLNIAESITKIPRIVKVHLDYDFPDFFCPAVAFQNSWELGTVCMTTPTPYDGENFTPEVKPDKWCVESLAYFGSAAPSIAASNVPSDAPSSTPSISNQPTIIPSTAEPTIDYFFADFADDDKVDNDSGARSKILMSSTISVGIVLLLSLLA